MTDNGNHILDCQIGPIADPPQLEMDIRAIPGVVGTGLFLGMADTVLVGDRVSFRLIEERRRRISLMRPFASTGPKEMSAGSCPARRFPQPTITSCRSCWCHYDRSPTRAFSR